VISIEKMVYAILDRVEVDVMATTLVDGVEHLGALKTAVVALATVDGEDTHPRETRTVLLANVRTEDTFADSILTGEFAGGLKGLGHHGLDVETFDDGAELGGKSGVHRAAKDDDLL
jgi:hypothetical protein